MASQEDPTSRVLRASVDSSALNARPSYGGDEPAGGRLTRHNALRRGIYGAAALIGGAAAVAALPRVVSSAPSREQDARILNFLLLLEYVQAGLYGAAREGASLQGELRTFAEVAGEQEREHVAYLREQLGGNAESAPDLAFEKVTSNSRAFMSAALQLEEATAAAYIGHGPNLTNPAMTAVVRIVPIEARHAAWIRSIAGRNPAPRAADPAMTPRDVLALLRRHAILQSG
jgi:hypothetical protein